VVGTVVAAGGGFNVGAGVGAMVGAGVGAKVGAMDGAGVVEAGAGLDEITQSFQPFLTVDLSAYHVMSSVGVTVCGMSALPPWYLMPLIVRKS